MRRERGGEPLRHREHHQPEPWPTLEDLPVNSNIPWAYTHISECCGNVLMQMMDYVRARVCVNACAGKADPAAEIERLRKAVATADLLADAVESANVGGLIDIAEVLGSVIPAVEAYRKERAS